MIAEICAQIESNSGDLSEALLKASQVFDKFNGLESDGSWEQDLLNLQVIEEEVKQLHDSIVRFIESHDGRLLGNAIWALGKLADPRDQSFFRACLKKRLSQQDGVGVYQCLIALGNLGEPVFGEHASTSMFDTEDNFRYAEAYLKSD